MLAFHSINGNGKNQIIFPFVFLLGGKYETAVVDKAYKVVMKLLVKSVGPSDFGSYKCVAKNSLGETDGTIKLYSKCCRCWAL